MKKFKIGQKVICVKGPFSNRSQPRKVGQVYEVQSIMYCPITGDQMININLSFKSTTPFITCTCGKDHRLTEHLMFTRSDHFCSVEDIEAEIKKCEKIEDYETASVLYAYTIMSSDY